VDERRLGRIADRAARAGVTIVEAVAIADAPPPGPFDLVFLDAPCSGSGTWRRQPELKWRLTGERLAALQALQDRLLDRAAACLDVGGRLLYATCSVLPCEDEDRIAAFLDRHPGFAIVPAAAIWRAVAPAAAPLPGPDDFFRASPYATGTDGFFAASMVRTA
jgi:16S rRNA (cytosine967-C5)-methyltransferase